MAKEVVLPRVDMDMATGKMGRWFVAEGERVREGQLLFEIETDKAAMEVEAPASGVLRGVRAQAGDALPVGSVVGWIVGEDEPFDPDLQALAGELRALLAASAPPAAASASPSEASRSRSAPAGSAAARRRWRAVWRAKGASTSQISSAPARTAACRRETSNFPSPRRTPSRRPSPPKARGSTACGCTRAKARRWCSSTASAPTSTAGARCSRHLPTPRPALALDLPGHGGSPLGGDASFPALVAAARAALAEEGIEAAHLVGHSLGGAVAAALAAEPGFRALSLMLIAPAGLGPEVNWAFLAGFLRARSEASLTPWMRLLVADPVSLGAALVKTTLAPARGRRAPRSADPPRRDAVPRRRPGVRRPSLARRSRGRRRRSSSAPRTRSSRRAKPRA